ncbi:polysaccharide deacetylase family protein [Bacillus inaquosorum]|uniref:Polysaccharide deacetylase family protein n=1 Tax=Bacillus inaquosorum TaxID=483913 RepID=A0A9Q4EQ90_9BACI|nr:MULTISPECIES: polysaccharide deacetylase family protein [Bacillus]TYS25516.1 polysaccharide deacetylase family protein [Bacillus subtilis]MCY7818745.1 polysaccharide deacetylase family protein [Bacillus inaquosorum]MCY7938241.1 polysaccharide deacetylase family protein [Bacillus inaquosorum]MCY7951205.1 polysaccharide deacetylase family protein [Bacillus inaquosorum]MCY7980702.1 polysaccharide deacetylase family protein [Bacillus inaquosorum]
MYKKFVPFAVFLFLFFVSFEMMKNPYALDYIGAMKKDTVTVTASKDPLYEELLQKAPEYEVKPQDARIDKVWKSIPGYNGLKVNIEKSYKKMKKHGEFRENDLVYSQVKPSVHLESLQPEPIYKGNPDKPMVAFLINVAWGNEYLEKMLPILQKHQVKATFFLEGNWVRNNEQLAKKIAEDGHEIGNHSYNHPDMSKLTTGRISEQLDKTNEQIEQTIGHKPKWFAPPSGSFRKAVVDIAAEKQMGTVMWTVDTIDWQKPAPSVLQTRVLSKIHNGAMILMHPTEPTAESLEALITKIKDKGYALGTVTELMDETRLLK